MSTTASPSLHFLQLTELSELLRTRAISPVEVTRAQLDRIAALDGRPASYVTVLADHALADAERAGREIATGHYRGPLHGVPVAIKDLFWTKDAPAAAGTIIYRDFRPGQDATAVTRLRDAGAVILGKLQMTACRSPASEPKSRAKLGCSEHNLHRMRYQHLRDSGMFVGSGRRGSPQADRRPAHQQSGTRSSTVPRTPLVSGFAVLSVVYAILCSINVAAIARMFYAGGEASGRACCQPARAGGRVPGRG